ncbi:MAG: hypothetical protein ACC700_10265, partial [Anaerolineales bacterium]
MRVARLGLRWIEDNRPLVFNLHPCLSMMPTIEQASSWYPENDPVHGFDHVLRVMRIAEQIGA